MGRREVRPDRWWDLSGRGCSLRHRNPVVADRGRPRHPVMRTPDAFAAEGRRGTGPHPRAGPHRRAGAVPAAAGARRGRRRLPRRDRRATRRPRTRRGPAAGAGAAAPVHSRGAGAPAAGRGAAAGRPAVPWAPARRRPNGPAIRTVTRARPHDRAARVRGGGLRRVRGPAGDARRSGAGIALEWRDHGGGPTDGGGPISTTGVDESRPHGC